MSTRPLVSVIIPTYNHQRFVPMALKSVFAQTLIDYEVIVVNDGSPDRTHDLLMPLAEAGRIRYFLQKNAGQAAARNRGIEAARGEFIALLDDDDEWPPEKLAEQYAKLHHNRATVLAYGRVRIIGPDSTPLTLQASAKLSIDIPPDGPAGQVFSAFVHRNYILSPGQTLIRRAALDTLNESPFDTALWGVDDYDLWLRLAEIGPFEFAPTTTLHYRIHDANASRNEARMHLNEMTLYRKHWQRARGNRQKRQEIKAGWRERRRHLSRYWLAMAGRAARVGHLREARERLITFYRLQRQ